MLDNVGQYFEYVLSRRKELPEVPEPLQLSLELGAAGNQETIRRMVGDFQTEMLGILGQRTGEMHRALASIKDRKEFAPEGFSQLYQRSVYQSMRNLLRQVFRTLEKNLNRFSGQDRNQAQTLLEQQNAILARFRRITGRKISAMKIRIHGDYHLGQVLFTGKDFVIIDFEGEPARPLSERRLKRSALRDVAGMVRSFHYAVYSGLIRNPTITAEDIPDIMPWVRAWYHYAASHFLQAYLATVGDAAFLPKKTEDANVLFDAFLLEKAVYELGYELNNRPDWAIIPIKGINYILEKES